MSFFTKLFASRRRPYIPHRYERDDIEIDLSGTKLQVQLLPHERFDGLGEEKVISKVNIFDSALFSDEDHLEEDEKQGIACLCLAQRFWELRGPFWQEQAYGFVDFSIVLVRNDNLLDGMSCFNPFHFEQMLLLSEYNNGPRNPQKPRKKAPVNWRVIENKSGNSIYYEAHPDFSARKDTPLSYEAARIRCHLCIPVDDLYYVRFNFHYHSYSPVEYCLKYMNELRNSVNDSVKVSLSHSSSQVLSDIKKKWPDASAKSEREPEPWVYPEWRRGDRQKGEPRIVIEKLGSPMPKFTL